MLSRDELKKFSESNCVQEKVAIAKRIAAAINSSGAEQAYEEVEQILNILAGDLAVEVRRALAIELHNNRLVPTEVIEGFLNDDDAVALPFLEITSLLSDEDLMNVIRTTKSIERQKAVARRRYLSAQVSHELVIKALDNKVLTTLLENETADIETDTLVTLLTDQKDSEDVMEALSHSPHFSWSILNRVTSHISQLLYDQLSKQLPVTPPSAGLIDEVKHNASQLSMLHYVEQHHTAAEYGKLAQLLFDDGELNSQSLLTALYVGKYDFMIAGLALLSGASKTQLEQWLMMQSMPPQFAKTISRTGIPVALARDVFAILRFTRRWQSYQGHDTMEEFVSELFNEIEHNPQHYPNHQQLLLTLRTHIYYRQPKL
jgi:uncharacterized protein (DUF2336 family)